MAKDYRTNPPLQRRVEVVRMTVKEYASHKRIHPQTVYRRIESGKIKFEQDGEHCKIVIPVRMQIQYF